VPNDKLLFKISDQVRSCCRGALLYRVRICGGSSICGGSKRPFSYNEWGLRSVHSMR